MTARAAPAAGYEPPAQAGGRARRNRPRPQRSQPREAEPRREPDADAYAARGMALGRAGRHKEAAEAYRAAIRLRPDDAGLYNNLGFAYAGQGMHREAVEAYRQAVRLDPAMADAFYNLGNAHRALNQREQVVEAYQQALKLSKELKESWALPALFELGELSGQLGRWADAVEAYKLAVAARPKDAFARYFLGEAYLRAGDRDAALEVQRALKTLDADLAARLSDLIAK